MNQLEERLRRQLDEAARDVTVPTDAWQQHQRLLAARRRNRWRNRSAVAAAAVAVAVAAGWVAGVGGDGRSAPPAGRTPAPDRSLPSLRGSVIVDRLTLPGDQNLSLHVGLAEVIEHTTDPELCTMLTFAKDGSNAASYGCARPVAESYAPEVAIDYVVAGFDDPWLTLAGAVDDRVARLQVWLRDGSSRGLPLHALPGSDRRAFGLLTNGGTQTPQRLLAFDQSGRLLQVHPIDQSVNASGAPAPDACAGQRMARFRTEVRDNGMPVPITVDLGAETAAIDLGGPNQCGDLAGELPIASWLRSGGTTVAVVGPEVARVRLLVAGRTWEAQPQQVEFSPWRVAVLTGTAEASGVLAALDATGQVIGTLFAEGYPVH